MVSQPNNLAIKEGEKILTFLKTSPEYPIALLNFLNHPEIH